jgi:hypothetical protein
MGTRRFALIGMYWSGFGPGDGAEKHAGTPPSGNAHGMAFLPRSEGRGARIEERREGNTHTLLAGVGDRAGEANGEAADQVRRAM